MSSLLQFVITVLSIFVSIFYWPIQILSQFTNLNCSTLCGISTIRSGPTFFPFWKNAKKREDYMGKREENGGETGRSGGCMEKWGWKIGNGSNFEYVQTLPSSPLFWILDGENGIETGAVWEQNGVMSFTNKDKEREHKRHEQQ